MDIDISYDSGRFVRQWDFDETGHPACLLDGVLSTDPTANAAMRKSIAVRGMVAAVEAYEGLAEKPTDADPIVVAHSIWRAGDTEKAQDVRSELDRRTAEVLIPEIE